MVKLRLTGTREDVDAALEKIKKTFDVLMVSRDYKNSNSRYVRVYLEVASDKVSQLTEQTLEKITAEELQNAYEKSKKENLI